MRISSDMLFQPQSQRWMVIVPRLTLARRSEPAQGTAPVPVAHDCLGLGVSWINGIDVGVWDELGCVVHGPIIAEKGDLSVNQLVRTKTEVFTTMHLIRT